MHRRPLVLAPVAAALGAAPLRQARAQAWPTKAVRFVVPFAPGGSSEIVARSVAAELTRSLGQSVYVENKPGGAGNVAMAEVAASTDQHTIILGHIGTLAVNPYIFAKLPYDPNRDFRPLTLLAKVPSLYVVRPDLPAKDLKEFVALAKQKPGALNYGSAGNGSAGHLAFEYRSSPICSAAGSTRPRSARRRCCRSSARDACAASRPAPRSASRSCPTCRRSRSRAIRASR